MGKPVKRLRRRTAPQQGNQVSDDGRRTMEGPCASRKPEEIIAQPSKWTTVVATVVIRVVITGETRPMKTVAPCPRNHTGPTSGPAKGPSICSPRLDLEGKKGGLAGKLSGEAGGCMSQPQMAQRWSRRATGGGICPAGAKDFARCFIFALETLVF
jgi:hypothetical protein